MRVVLPRQRRILTLAAAILVMGLVSLVVVRVLHKPRGIEQPKFVQALGVEFSWARMALLDVNEDGIEELLIWWVKGGETIDKARAGLTILRKSGRDWKILWDYEWSGIGTIDVTTAELDDSLHILVLLSEWLNDRSNFKIIRCSDNKCDVVLETQLNFYSAFIRFYRMPGDKNGSISVGAEESLRTYRYEKGNSLTEYKLLPEIPKSPDSHTELFMDAELADIDGDGQLELVAIARDIVSDTGGGHIYTFKYDRGNWALADMTTFPHDKPSEMTMVGLSNNTSATVAVVSSSDMLISEALHLLRWRRKAMRWEVYSHVNPDVVGEFWEIISVCVIPQLDDRGETLLVPFNYFRGEERFHSSGIMEIDIKEGKRKTILSSFPERLAAAFCKPLEDGSKEILLLTRKGALYSWHIQR